MNSVGKDSACYAEHVKNDSTTKKLLQHSRDGAVYSVGLWKNLIVDFTLSFLITNPADLIAFGLEYFDALRTKRVYVDQWKANEDTAFPMDSTLNSVMEESYSYRRKNFSSSQTKDRRKTVFNVSSSMDSDDSWKPEVHSKTDEQRRNCIERLNGVMLFKEVLPEDLSQLIDAMFFKEVELGDKVITQGEDGDYFYIIDSGLYHAYYESQGKVKTIAKYNNHGTFGELALMYNVPRTCSIVAHTKGGLWGLDRATFRKIVLNSAKARRQRYMNFLRNVPLFKHLTEYEMWNLSDSLVRKSYESEDLIIKQGDIADGMYFIEEGTVGLTMTTVYGDEVALRELGVGEYFGELALLEKQPRAATARAIGEVKLAFLCVDAFERLLGSCRAIMETRAHEYKKNISGRQKLLSDSKTGLDKPERKSTLPSDNDSPPSKTSKLSEHRFSVAFGNDVQVIDPDQQSRSPRHSNRSSRTSKFTDRKPSIFQVLPEVMRRSSVAFSQNN